MKRLLFIAVSCIAAWPWGPAEAQSPDFPSRPITLVVPFGAGGPTDIIARVAAERMSGALGQRVVVENVAGAAGTTGAARVARAAPDGHTLLLGPMSTMSFSPATFSTLSFDPLADFEPVGIVASAPIMLVTRNDVPARSPGEFAAHLRADTARMANGNAGVGSTSHLSCFLFNQRIGVEPALVPYRSTAPALQDLIGGQIGYVCDQITSVMGQVQNGQVRPVAILAATRSPVLPEVPTAAEGGFPGIEMVVWNALFAPKGTPPAVVEQLNTAVGRALDDARVRERFLQLGAEAPAGAERTPAALRETHRRDVERWGRVIRDANVRLD